jgi:hypothetical protein
MSTAPISNIAYREQQLENRITLLVFQTYDPLGKSRIHEKDLLLCDRVHPHNGMIALNWIASHKVTIPGRLFRLRKTTVFSPETLQEYFERLGQAVVRCGL